MMATWLWLMLAGCGGHAAGEEAGPVGPRRIAEGLMDLSVASRSWLRVEAVDDGSLALPVDAPARIEVVPEGRSRLSAAVSGVVERVFVTAGQRVSAGDALIALRSPEAARRRLELTHSSARVEAAEAEVARQKRLLADGVGRQAEVLGAEVALAEARVAQGEARGAARALGAGGGEEVVVRAHADGRVAELTVRPGQWVEPGAEALVEVVSGEALQAVVEVRADDADLVAEGDAAVVMVPGFGEIKGVVLAIGGQVDPASGRVAIVVDLEADKALRAGQRARARLMGRLGARPSVEVGAVILRPDRSRAVWVEVGEGRYQRRTVEVGRIAAGRAEILVGLAPGERVVSQGALLLDESAERML